MELLSPLLVDLSKESILMRAEEDCLRHVHGARPLSELERISTRTARRMIAKLNHKAERAAARKAQKNAARKGGEL